MTLDPDAAARASLARHHAVATGLLLGMAGLTVGSAFLPAGYAAELLRAAAKSGVVGGLADWFAVTALFRHPLGLPIPHTAIIPRQKARLGAALGSFVANHVLSEADVAPLLAKIDAPGLVGRMLEAPDAAAPAVAALARMLPKLLGSLEDGRARRLVSRLAPRLLGGQQTGVIVARALRGLVAGGQHQQVFGFVLEQLRLGMLAQEEVLRHAVEDRVREHGGRLVGWAVGASIAKRVLSALNAEFEKIEPGESDLRVAFDEWVRREIDRIEQEPARAAEIGRAVRDVVAHETVQAWFWDVFGRLRGAIERDAEDTDGRSQALLRGALADFGRTLAEDEAMRARLEGALSRIVMGALPALRAQIADFIARVVGSWDTATIVDKLELRVGRDLQYVRINGTLVGFLVGGALYALMRAVFPALRF